MIAIQQLRLGPVHNRRRLNTRAIKGAKKLLYAKGRIARSASFIAVSRWVLIIMVLSGLGALVLPGVAGAEETATIQASVQIQSMVQLSITGCTPLCFGQIRPGETDGWVTVTTSNERFATGGVGLQAPFFSRAEFIITGTPDATYSIVPGHPLMVHDQRPNPIPGVTALEVIDLLIYSTTVGPPATISPGTGQIGPGGVDTVYVGGTLVVPSTAKNGSYAGHVQLTINY